MNLHKYLHSIMTKMWKLYNWMLLALPLFKDWIVSSFFCLYSEINEHYKTETFKCLQTNVTKLHIFFTTF